MSLMDDLKKDTQNLDMQKVEKWAQDNGKTIEEAKEHFMNKKDDK